MALLAPLGGQTIAFSNATTAASARAELLAAAVALIPTLTAAEQAAITDYATPGTRPCTVDNKSWVEIPAGQPTPHRAGRTYVTAMAVPVEPTVAQRLAKAVQGTL